MVKEIPDGQEKCKALQKELENLHETLTKTEESLERVRGSEASLMSSVEGLQEVKMVLDARVTELDEELKAEIGRYQSLKQEDAAKQVEIGKLTGKVRELEEAKMSLGNQLTELHTASQQEKEDRAKEAAAMQEAKQLLIKHKLDLQSQLMDKETQLAKLEAEFGESKEVAHKVQTMLRDESAALQNKLASEEQAKADLQHQMEELEQRSNMQLSALNENLATLRSDLSQADTRKQELEKVVDELRGEAAVLEATIQNNQDERRTLLERCLASEGDVEKLQTKVVELRRKLDDAQAAMHELGRENQNLQIVQSKQMARKWADDTEVKSCMACDKAFSVTVRRHHCRQCGNIFCNECSAKSATIASSKKPVRVCDNCYSELTS
ncbi:early endosome antigen 1-like [Acanthaster planci]|uniref:Early endosome antigen 1-like n=1 Tax=Acanthaster planci TaxID=133434 RepID=A0A8B7ZG47_ACAPL|nr:early endosome antigen 1-like [Acanthaster planci]